MGKEIITFGVAGTLDVDAFEQQEQARITFHATASYSSKTEKFKAGDVTHVLAIDPKSFVIDSVEEPPVQESLPEGGEE